MRYLLALPGVVQDLTGKGEIGRLKDMDTPNPVFVLSLEEGELHLQGSIIYPKNRYVTLQCGAKAGGDVLCEDVFDSVVAFQSATWEGKDGKPPPTVISKGVFGVE